MARGIECRDGKDMGRMAGSRTEVCQAGKTGVRAAAGEKICHGEKPKIQRRMYVETVLWKQGKQETAVDKI